MHGERLGNFHLSLRQGLAEAEMKSLPDLCPERVGAWQRDMGNAMKAKDIKR